MNDEFDYDLTHDQWEALKALRMPVAKCPGACRFALNSLIVLGLAAARDDLTVITPRGRKVLIRGSSRLLLDLAV